MMVAPGVAKVACRTMKTPRRKSSDSYSDDDRRGDKSGLSQKSSSRRISLETLEDYYHLPLNTASKGLGVSVTLLKKLCREYAIQRWPFRQVSSIRAALQQMREAQAAASTSEERDEYERKIQHKKKQLTYIVKGASSGLNSSTRNAIFNAKPEELDGKEMLPTLCALVDLKNADDESSSLEDDETRSPSASASTTASAVSAETTVRCWSGSAYLGPGSPQSPQSSDAYQHSPDIHGVGPLYHPNARYAPGPHMMLQSPGMVPMYATQHWHVPAGAPGMAVTEHYMPPPHYPQGYYCVARPPSPYNVVGSPSMTASHHTLTPQYHARSMPPPPLGAPQPPVHTDGGQLSAHPQQPARLPSVAELQLKLEQAGHHFPTRPHPQQHAAPRYNPPYAEDVTHARTQSVLQPPRVASAPAAAPFQLDTRSCGTTYPSGGPRAVWNIPPPVALPRVVLHSS